MNQSVIWSMMNVQRDRQVGNALDSLRAAIESMPDGPNRQQAQMALQQVTKTVGPAMPPRGPQGQPAPAPGQVRRRRRRRCPIPTSSIPKSVKGALVEAMLDYSLQMNLGPEEWLTVAARASEGPMPPAGPVGPHHDRAARQGKRPVGLSRRPDQAGRDSSAGQGRSPRVLIYNPRHAGQGPHPCEGRLARDVPPLAGPCCRRLVQQAGRFQAGPPGDRRLRRLVRLRDRRRQEQARAERHVPDSQARRRPPAFAFAERPFQEDRRPFKAGPGRRRGVRRSVPADGRVHRRHADGVVDRCAPPTGFTGDAPQTRAEMLQHRCSRTFARASSPSRARRRGSSCWRSISRARS